MLICSQAWQIQVVSPSTNVCIWVEVQTWALDCGVQTKTEALEWLEERWGQTQMPSQALNCATFCQNTSGSMLSLFFCCWSKKKETSWTGARRYPSWQLPLQKWFQYTSSEGQCLAIISLLNKFSGLTMDCWVQLALYLFWVLWASL